MKEQLVAEMIYGERPTPPELSLFVNKYRLYAKERGECVAYPRHKDAEMDAIFDALCAVVQ